jgi:hypothetical protein
MTNVLIPFNIQPHALNWTKLSSKSICNNIIKYNDICNSLYDQMRFNDYYGNGQCYKTQNFNKH